MAVSFRNMCLLAVVVLVIIGLGNVFELKKGYISFLIPAEVSEKIGSDSESELSFEPPPEEQQERTTTLSKADRWKEVNATTSSLTERSFLYQSNNTVNENENENGAVSVWNFERLQVVVMAKNSNNSSSSSSIATTKSSLHWTKTDVERWCPQPVLSVLESPKLVKAKDYQDQTIYPESYASHNYSAVAEEHRLFTIPSIKNNSFTLTIVDSEKIVKAAVCRFHQDWHKMAVHFPHAMQEIYACVDYWITNKGADATTDPIIPVLLYNHTSQENMMMRWKTNEFMRGIIGVLQEEMGVVIMTSEDYMNCATFDINDNKNDHSIPETTKQMEVCNRVYHPEQTIRTSIKVFQGFYFQKATEFNVYVESFLRKQNRTYQQESLYHPRQWKTDADSRVCARPPKIGILNRESTRGIINADQMAEDLSELRYVYRKPDDGDNATKDSIEGYPVEVIFFEGLSFAEQVEFFWRTDIVVSGHGAQLTGLPFLKVDENVGRCRQVMELYPYEHIIPYYFGSLVVGTGMSHSYVYYDDGLRPERTEDPGGSRPRDRPPLRVRPLSKITPWKGFAAADIKDRVVNRRSEFCPRRDDVVDYLSELIFDWYRCHGC